MEPVLVAAAVCGAGSVVTCASANAKRNVRRLCDPVVVAPKLAVEALSSRPQARAPRERAAEAPLSASVEYLEGGASQGKTYAVLAEGLLLIGRESTAVDEPRVALGGHEISRIKNRVKIEQRVLQKVELKFDTEKEAKEWAKEFEKNADDNVAQTLARLRDLIVKQEGLLVSKQEKVVACEGESKKFEEGKVDRDRDRAVREQLLAKVAELEFKLKELEPLSAEAANRTKHVESKLLGLDIGDSNGVSKQIASYETMVKDQTAELKKLRKQLALPKSELKAELKPELRQELRLEMEREQEAKQAAEARALAAAGPTKEEQSVTSAIRKLAGAKGKLEDLLRDASSNEDRMNEMQEELERATKRAAPLAVYGGAPAVYGGAPAVYGGAPAVYGGAPAVYAGAPAALGAPGPADNIRQRSAVRALADAKSKLETLLEASKASAEKSQSLDDLLSQASLEVSVPAGVGRPAAVPAMTYAAPPSVTAVAAGEVVPLQPGFYVIDFEGTVVTAGSSTRSNDIAELPRGARVEVLEIVLIHEEEDRVRGRIAPRPGSGGIGGWISLLKLSTRERWATQIFADHWGPTEQAKKARSPSPSGLRGAGSREAQKASVSKLQTALQQMLQESTSTFERAQSLEGRFAALEQVTVGPLPTTITAPPLTYGAPPSPSKPDKATVDNVNRVQGLLQGLLKNSEDNSQRTDILESTLSKLMDGQVPVGGSALSYSAPIYPMSPGAAVAKASPRATAGLTNLEGLLNQLLKDQQNNYQKSQRVLETAETMDVDAGLRSAAASNALASNVAAERTQMQAKLEQQEQRTRDEKAKAAALAEQLKVMEQADARHAAALREMEKAAAAGKQSEALSKRLEQAETQLTTEQASTADLQGRLAQISAVASQRQAQLEQLRKEAASDKAMAERTRTAEERSAQASAEKGASEYRATAAERTVASLKEDAERSAKARKDLNDQIGVLKASLKDATQNAPSVTASADPGLQRRLSKAEQEAADVKRSSEAKIQTLTKEFEGEISTARRDLAQAKKDKGIVEERTKTVETRNKGLQDRNEGIVKERDAVKSQLEVMRKERDSLRASSGGATMQSGGDDAAQLQRKLTAAESRATAAESLKRSIDTELRTTKRSVEREQAKSAEAETKRKAAEERAVAAEAASRAKAGGASAAPASGDALKLERRAKDAEAKASALKLERDGFQIQLQNKDKELRELRAGGAAVDSASSRPVPSYLTNAYASRAPASPSAASPPGSGSNLYSSTRPAASATAARPAAVPSGSASPPGSGSNLYSSTRPAASATAARPAGGAYTSSSTFRLSPSSPSSPQTATR